MSENEHTTPDNPEQMSKTRLLSLRLRNDWFFLKQRVRMAWWPNKIKQLDRERKDWQRWCRDAEQRLRDGGLVAIEPDYGAAKTLLREKLGYFDFEDPPTEDAVIEWLPDLINAALTKEDQ